MSDDRDLWGRRLDAGEATDDAELQLAARVRAARPPVRPLSAQAEAALRARVLSAGPAPANGPAWRHWAFGLAALAVTVVVGVLALAPWWQPQTPLSSAPGVVPTWPVPTPFRLSDDDWVTLEVAAPPVGAELAPGLVTVRARYSLSSAPEAVLRVELRNRLDYDLVDLGSDLSNLVARGLLEVTAGAGETTFELAAPAETLARFPAGSQLVLTASLLDGAGGLIFHEVFEPLAYTTPDLRAACGFDPARDSVELLSVTPPAGGMLSTTSPLVRVTVRYALTTAHPELYRLVGYLADPDRPPKSDALSQVPGLLYAQSEQTLTAAAGTVTLDLYSWFVDEQSRERLSATGQVTLGLALMCGQPAAQPQAVWAQAYPEHLFAFGPELLPGAPRDAVTFAAASPAGGVLPAEVDVTIAYTLTTAPTATLHIAFADPAWDGELASIGDRPRWVGELVTVVGQPEANQFNPTVTVRLPAAGALESIARNGEVALFAEMYAFNAQGGHTRVAHTVAGAFRYQLPGAAADTVKVVGVTPAAGAWLPDRITQFDVTVAYTLTSAPEATLVVGLGNDAWTGAETDPQAGAIFAVGAAPVTLPADQHLITVPFYFNPESTLRLLSGDEARLFANLSARDAAGRWQRLAFDLSRDFAYPLATAPGTVFSADGQVYARIEAGRVRVWDRARGAAPAYELDGVRPTGLALALSADGQQLAALASDGALTLWDLAAGTRLDANLGVGVGRALTFAPVNRTLTLAGSEVVVVSVDDLRVVQRATRPAAPATTVAYSPDGTLILIGRQDGQVEVWPRATLTLADAYPAQKTPVRQVAATPDNQRLVVGAWGEPIAVVERGARQATFLSVEPGAVFALSPSGQRLAVGHPTGQVAVWDLTADLRLADLGQLPGGAVSALAFADGGAQVVASDETNAVREWAAPASLASLPPATCAVTRPPQPPFTPPAAYPPVAPAPNFWVGGNGLWTALPADGVWSALPRHADGYGQKLFWWREGFVVGQEGPLTVTGRRLDAAAPPLLVSSPTNASTPEYGDGMLVGVGFPTLGCWEITGRYADAELTYVVWVAP